MANEGRMSNVVAVRKWAQSRAIVIPSGIAKQLGWRVSDLCQVDVQGDALIVRKVVLPKMPAVTGRQQPAAGEEVEE